MGRRSRDAALHGPRRSRPRSGLGLDVRSGPARGVPDVVAAPGLSGEPGLEQVGVVTGHRVVGVRVCYVGPVSIPPTGARGN